MFKPYIAHKKANTRTEETEEARDHYNHSCRSLPTSNISHNFVQQGIKASFNKSYSEKMIRSKNEPLVLVRDRKPFS